MEADQDMNWKIEWDIGFNVDQQDTGFDTDFGIGLGDCLLPKVKVLLLCQSLFKMVKLYYVTHTHT